MIQHALVYTHVWHSNLHPFVNEFIHIQIQCTVEVFCLGTKGGEGAKEEVKMNKKPKIFFASSHTHAHVLAFSCEMCPRLCMHAHGSPYSSAYKQFYLLERPIAVLFWKFENIFHHRHFWNARKFIYWNGITLHYITIHTHVYMYNMMRWYKAWSVSSN